MTLLKRLNRLKKLSNRSRKMGLDFEDISLLRRYLMRSLSKRNEMYRCNQLDTKTIRRIVIGMCTWRVIDEMQRQIKEYGFKGIYTILAGWKMPKKKSVSSSAATK